MSGVQLVPAAQAPLLARPYYARGDPGAIVATLAHVPEVLEVAMPFIGTVLGPSSLDARTKEIVILRTSARLGCRFCVQTHTVAARDAGLSPGEVRALRGEAPGKAAFPDPGELALLGWVDAVANQLKNNLGIEASGAPVPTFAEFRTSITDRVIQTPFRTGYQIP